MGEPMLKNMQDKEVLKMVKEYTTVLFNERLSTDHYFHNLKHTQEVVQGCIEICTNLDFSPEEITTVSVAAWFHDTGYCNTYKDHEIESTRTAIDFLTSLHFSEQRIDEITSLIRATKYPQQPTTLMEKVICDADFYHFSREDYPAHEKALRKEWEIYLHLTFSDSEWTMLNYEMLRNHTYFTSYGQKTLQIGKDKNIKNLAGILNYNQDENNH